MLQVGAAEEPWPAIPLLRGPCSLFSVSELSEVFLPKDVKEGMHLKKRLRRYSYLNYETKYTTRTSDIYR